MKAVTQAEGAGVKGEAEREMLIASVRKLVRGGKSDSEVADLVSKETGAKVSVHRVRKIRGGVLGIKKPGGHFGRRSKSAKAKARTKARRKPAKRAATKAARRPAAKRRVQKAPFAMPKLNGAGSHLRAALAEMEAHAAQSLVKAKQFQVEAKVLSTHAKYLRRVLRTMA